MKKVSIILIVLAFFMFLTFGTTYASGAPRRNSTPVDDAFKPYTADEWIVSPDEEPTGDQNVSNAPECDIYGVISCYDKDYLRVDILLNNSITEKLDTIYGIRLEYDTMNEYYTYEVLTKKLIYQKEQNGKIVETRDLTQEKTDDTAGISNSGDLDNSDVYFIINKENHIGGTVGKRYYLAGYFFSGFYDKKGKINMADETIDVDLEFER